MCELFGLSASQRIAGPELTLNEFQARGGATADNPDGWGIAWRDDSDFQLQREPLPGHRSARFAGHGKFDFLLSDGEHPIAYGHDRLHSMESRKDGVASVLVATEPLGNAERWTSFEAGESRIDRAGLPVGRISTQPRGVDSQPLLGSPQHA
jgi:predicted glutamine amidotransferase